MTSILLQQAETLIAAAHNTGFLQSFEMAVRLCRTALSQGHKLLLIGNGGSAADAQHWAAELVVRFQKDRQALPAIALSTDTSTLTAIGNDFRFEDIFSRQIEALGRPGDVLLAITTSGQSRNIRKACVCAQQQKVKVVGVTSSQTPQDFIDVCDVCLRAPAIETARIQEIHAIFGHALCALLESSLFLKG
ncbi:MAG: SIS domain-containing protein [Holosporales bacterium]|nr:SIS domain-containing protein [Holosporales bacterium]